MSSCLCFYKNKTISQYTTISKETYTESQLMAQCVSNLAILEYFEFFWYIDFFSSRFKICIQSFFIINLSVYWTDTELSFSQWK